MQKIFGFTAANGIHFIALSAERDGKQVIKFFDARYPKCQSPASGIPAQFVSEYYATTLYRHEGGLCLYGGIEDWRIDEASLQAVKKALINPLGEVLAGNSKSHGKFHVVL